MTCFYLKAEQNVEEYFEFLKMQDQKPDFTANSNIPKYSTILDFSKYINRFEFRAQKAIRISIQMLQKQRKILL
jgi:hypothetical protein